MRRASERLLSDLRRRAKSGAISNVERLLSEVAEAFVTSQQARLDADYATSRVWLRADAVTHVKEVRATFGTWNVIRNEPSAQAYLVSMLAK